MRDTIRGLASRLGVFLTAKSGRSRKTNAVTVVILRANTLTEIRVMCDEATCGKYCDDHSKLEVSADTKAAATKCWANFACLSGGRQPMCEVKQWLSNKYAFVNAGPPAPCPYSVPFGMVSRVCGCPVRNELYRRHGK